MMRLKISYQLLKNYFSEKVVKMYQRTFDKIAGFLGLEGKLFNNET